MFSSDISSELKDVLKEVTPKFEEHFKRAFQNEGFRRQTCKEKKEMHQLDDVLFSAGDNIIELKDLKILRGPDFRISSLFIDFPMLTVNIALTLGDVIVEGDYVVNNRTLKYFFPLTHTGKTEVIFQRVVATGRIGMSIKEDSFVFQHFDLTYTPLFVTAFVSYKDDKSDMKFENEISNTAVEATIATTFWKDLKATITSSLHEQMQAVVAEESISELLGETEEELRNHAHNLALKGNRLFDSLLCTAKGRIVSESARLLRTPTLDVLFKGRYPSQQQGSLEANEGYIQDLSTLSRSNDVSFYENEQEVIIYGCLNLREFKYGYKKYKSQYARTYVEGSITTTAYRNKILLKISLSKSTDNSVTQLDSIQFSLVNDVDIVVSGLGSLTWLAKDVKSWMIGKLKGEVLPIIEKRIANAFEYAIRVTDCVSLLIE
ncbi:hypothetical protein FQA39_LY03031 [Lamprigera yunnana]|nr:hypothetical protein FQA39_LY03031 [Lamprigera yunnana]